MNANYKVGESFAAQFVWKIPGGDYVRAVFKAEVLDLVPRADRYVVRLRELIAGRQENEDGVARPETELSKEHWAWVGKIVGRRISLAYEADDGRAIHMRFTTLTGEHNFFYRFPD